MSKLMEGEIEEALSGAIEKELAGKVTSGDSVKQKKDKKPKTAGATTATATTPAAATPTESKKKSEGWDCDFFLSFILASDRFFNTFFSHFLLLFFFTPSSRIRKAKEE